MGRALPGQPGISSGGFLAVALLVEELELLALTYSMPFGEDVSAKADASLELVG